MKLKPWIHALLHIGCVALLQALRHARGGAAKESKSARPARSKLLRSPTSAIQP